jgi:hypothetical protein
MAEFSIPAVDLWIQLLSVHQLWLFSVRFSTFARKFVSFSLFLKNEHYLELASQDLLWIFTRDKRNGPDCSSSCLIPKEFGTASYSRVQSAVNLNVFWFEIEISQFHLEFRKLVWQTCSNILLHDKEAQSSVLHRDLFRVD